MLPTLLFAVCFVPGSLLLVWALYQVIMDQISRSWPSVIGSVLSVQEHDAHHRGSLTVTVTYEYEVAGTRYIGKRYSFGYARDGIRTLNGSKYCEDKIRRDIPDRPRVLVFYNRRRPGQARLMTAPVGVHLLNFLFASVVLAFQTWMYFGLRSHV